MTIDRFFSASIDHYISVIDLHETDSVHEALDLLERQLFRLVQEEKLYCRVVHGIGEGMLAEAVHRALKSHPLVTSWREEPDGGSCLVLL